MRRAPDARGSQPRTPSACHMRPVTAITARCTVHCSCTLNQGTRDNLRNWRISRVLDAIERVLDPYTPNMPQGLQEAYTTFWSQFSGQARLVRNDAGHPKSVDPVDEPTVHGVLLMFPTHAKLAADLVAWMPTGVV